MLNVFTKCNVSCFKFTFIITLLIISYFINVLNSADKGFNSSCFILTFTAVKDETRLLPFAEKNWKIIIKIYLFI